MNVILLADFLKERNYFLSVNYRRVNYIIVCWGNFTKITCDSSILVYLTKTQKNI